MNVILLYSWHNGRHRWIGWRLWKRDGHGGGRAVFDLCVRWWLR